MSSCLSGGLDLEIMKSQSPTTSSSTLSESSNSRLAVCTRKPRTPRKRRNQSYNEAAALLSTACPTIFSAKQFTKQPHKFTKQPYQSFFDQSSDLLLPYREIHSPCFRIDPKPYDKPCLSPAEIDSKASRATVGEIHDYDDDFDAESIIDEELEEGIIDSIMGDVAAENGGEMPQIGDPIDLGFMGCGGKIDLGFGIRRREDEENWWCSPTVDVVQICPTLNKKQSATAIDFPIADTGQPLLLKLNYKEVATAWKSKSNKTRSDNF